MAKHTHLPCVWIKTYPRATLLLAFNSKKCDAATYLIYPSNDLGLKKEIILEKSDLNAISPTNDPWPVFIQLFSLSKLPSEKVENKAKTISTAIGKSCAVYTSDKGAFIFRIGPFKTQQEAEKFLKDHKSAFEKIGAKGAVPSTQATGIIQFTIINGKVFIISTTHVASSNRVQEKILDYTGTFDTQVLTAVTQMDF